MSHEQLKEQRPFGDQEAESISINDLYLLAAIWRADEPVSRAEIRYETDDPEGKETDESMGRLLGSGLLEQVKEDGIPVGFRVRADVKDYFQKMEGEA